MPKNIVILCDGTGQIGGVGASTNVYKLFNMLEDRTPNQVVYYDAGIGSGGRKYFDQITGHGFKHNMLECYQFLFDQYEAGDKVFLFGFSRGAATVRSLSGFIELFGVLPQSRRDLISKAYDIYKMKTHGKEHNAGVQHHKRIHLNSRERAAKAFVEKHHTMWTRIRFLGVWDTVAALGFGDSKLGMLVDRWWPHRFHNFKLSAGVDYARHALSIDDERKTFHPLIWAPLHKDEPADRLKQVWFCGVHTDVGGGYNEAELSYYSLDWMIREATDKGLLIHKEGTPWKEFQQVKYDVEGMMHNEQIGFWKKKIYPRAVRFWPEDFGPVCLHESVLERKKNNANQNDPCYKPWILSVKERTTTK